MKITIVLLIVFVSATTAFSIEMELELQRKWNLIAIPGSTSYDLITDLLPIVPPAYTYEPGVGYEAVYTFPPPSKGFWALSAVDTTIRFSYDPGECTDTLYVSAETLYISAETLYIAVDTLYIATDTLYIGSEGAWEIIEVITLDSDTEVVTFEGIGDEWDITELYAIFSLTGSPDEIDAEVMYMRINDDTLENYYMVLHGGLRWVNAFEICTAIDEGISLHAILYNYYENGIHEVTWKYANYKPLGGYHTSDGGERVRRIDIFNDPSPDMSIAEGSTFILMGLDTD